ncbi:FmdB family zinc ribbon protein [Fundidesulfovibrio agrisoli]|uniref:FmdB family zinc ribbon protein n=1 Tax=Fundidesulfovibrio agrisoli TaxID=2922717 RepID=UPI001FAB465B|nr:zinc ribbon domain-containing protein [Fundidesulfovibrio agrisoli]
MPIYEYQCRACYCRFEEIRHASAADKPACPSCASQDVVRLMSAPSPHGLDGPGLSGPSSGGPGGGPGGGLGGGCGSGGFS